MVACLAGCARQEQRADVVIANGAEPESLDPAVLTGQPDGRPAAAMFEGLTRLNPVDSTSEPGLAERWEISEDGRTYVFHLRTNAMWSTGEPITADDFVFSWRRVVDPATACDYSGLLFYVVNGEEIATAKIKDLTKLGVRALGTRTLEVKLVSPTAFFLDLCAFRTMAVVPRKTIEKYGDRWIMAKPLPVSGSHLLESWRIRDKIRLRRNPLYWDAANAQNEIVDILPIDTAMAALNLYETRQVDIVWDKSLVPNELMDVLTNRADCHRFDNLGTYFVRFNVRRKPFDDVRVRKALSLVINKRRIIDRILRGQERIARSMTPPGTANYDPPEGLGYDPALARKFLAEAGYPDGKGFRPFEYFFNSLKMHEQIGVELQEMWKKELGITMTLRQTEWKVYLAMQSALEYDTTRSSWIGDYNDPNTFLDMFMSNNGNNRTGWRNERYDRLMKEANSLLNKEQRAAKLREAETLLVRDEVPILPIFFYQSIHFWRREEIRGIHYNILDEHPLHAIGKNKSSKLQVPNSKS
ncbi:MAG TPA: peptide ABC transporter substrate-binding protein [Candidatus Binatia bacterium]|nr:peptide ABC transporter substrate-binding protein [Candidatus Binatia bacterium]